MGYSFMRMIVFFDLPVKTKNDRKIYSKFRKELIKKGFFMIQFSVYSKILANIDSATHEKESIRKIAPEVGHIRIMIVTEKQYAKMDIIIGGKTRQEKEITEEAMIVL